MKELNKSLNLETYSNYKLKRKDIKLYQNAFVEEQ
jgi:hypothetical protein